MTHRLAQLTRHFVIDTAKMTKCCKMKPTCFKEVQWFAKAVLVLQTNPKIIYLEWRSQNPFLKINYMGDQPMIFDTEALYVDIKIAGRPKCECAPTLILRSNDGINPELTRNK